jgi:hypothetical protein
MHSAGVPLHSYLQVIWVVYELRDYDLFGNMLPQKVAMGKGDTSQWITLECCSMMMNCYSFYNCVFLEQSGSPEGYIEAIERSLMDGGNDD